MYDSKIKEIEKKIGEIDELQAKADSLRSEVCDFNDFWGSPDSLENKIKNINNGTKNMAHSLKELKKELENLSPIFDNKQSQEICNKWVYIVAKLKRLTETVNNAQHELIDRSFWSWAYSLLENLGNLLRQVIDDVKEIVVGGAKKLIAEGKTLFLPSID